MASYKPGREAAEKPSCRNLDLRLPASRPVMKYISCVYSHFVFVAAALAS